MAQGGGWGNSHSCTRCLAPVGVAEFDEVISEDNLHGFGECLCVVVVELFARFLVEEVCDVGDGGFCTMFVYMDLASAVKRSALGGRLSFASSVFSVNESLKYEG